MVENFSDDTQHEYNERPAIDPLPVDTRIYARIVHDLHNPDWPTGNRITDPQFQADYPNIRTMTAEVVRLNPDRRLGGLNITKTDRYGWIDFERYLNDNVENAMTYLHTNQAYYNAVRWDAGELSPNKWSIATGGNPKILDDFKDGFWRVKTMNYWAGPPDGNYFNPWVTPEWFEYQTVIGWSHKYRRSFWTGAPILGGYYPIWAVNVEDRDIFIHQNYVELFPLLPTTVMYPDTGERVTIVHYELKGPNVYGLTANRRRIVLEEWGDRPTTWSMRNYGTPARGEDFKRWMEKTGVARVDANIETDTGG